MTPGEFVLGFYSKMFKIWWPVLAYIIVGLAVLAYVERRDKLDGRAK